MLVIEESELNWPCYECPEKFRSSALLQKHLAEHDEPVHDATGDAETAENTAKRPQGRPRKRGYRASRRHSRMSAKNNQKTDDEVCQPQIDDLYFIENILYVIT